MHCICGYSAVNILFQNCGLKFMGILISSSGIHWVLQGKVFQKCAFCYVSLFGCYVETGMWKNLNIAQFIVFSRTKSLSIYVFDLNCLFG